MAQYKTETVSSGFFADLDTMIDNKARDEGRDGWRLTSVTPVGKDKARCEFVKG